MKKRLLALLLGLVTLLGALPALAQDTIWCSPQDVDVSQVQKIDGRLVGEIGIPQEDGYRHILRIDCPVPEGFSQEQQMKLHVTYRDINKKELAAAMKELGQKASTDDMRRYKSSWESRWIWYGVKGQDTNGNGSFSYPYVQPGYQSAAHPEAVRQANERLNALAGQLGIDLWQPGINATRQIPEDLMASYSASESDSAWYQEAYERCVQKHSEDNLTLLTAGYELYGLPVLHQFVWSDSDGQNWYAASSELRCAVSDEGEFLEIDLWGVPVVESTEPMQIPERSWQELLKACVSQCYWPNSVAEDIQVKDDPLYGDYTKFASYEVITSISPCWLGREKACLEPGWTIQAESRVLKDDSLCGWWEKSLSALDLQIY